MKLPQTKFFRWNYLLIAFLIPVILFIGLLLVSGCMPFFSNKSMLYSDMYHQYFPFFVEYRNALRSGNGLLYNWNIGMGLDYLGLISYYLASPLNLVSVLLPESWLLGYFSLLSPIKLGLASLFFAVFLKKVFRKNDLSISLFGALYGLCAWALGYQWNVMWLDTFALLPLVALGTLSLLQERKFVLYTVTLALSVFANYYIGFFTCIFVLLLCLCYEICRFKGFKRLLMDFVLMACFSALAIGMTAILELPALAALQTTQSSVNNFPTEFRLNIVSQHDIMGLLDAMRQVAGNMGGGLIPTFKEGLPNLYCGVGTVILAFLYLTSHKISLRDKICAVVMLLLFMVSFIIRQLDYIWHGFHFTNMIPYRFSFLFSFVMLYMAYKAYTLRRHFKLWQVIVSAVFALGIFLCNFQPDAVYIAYNLIFWIIYTAILLYPTMMHKLPENASPIRRRLHKALKVQKRKVATYSLAGILIAELILSVVNFGLTFDYTGISDYPQGTQHTENAVAKMEELESDNPFYRAEVTHSQTLNDGSLIGYSGVSTFTSSANVRVTEFMRALGYGAKNTYNRYCYEEASPVANLFLGLKYMIDRSGVPRENAYFDTVYQSGHVRLLQNNASLPLGFLADVQLTNVNFFGTVNIFQFENSLLSASTGITEDAWYRLPKDRYDITSDTVEINPRGGAGHCAYEATEAGKVVYTITAKESGFMCLSFNLPKRNRFTVSHNEQKLYSDTYSLPQNLAVANVEPGDTVSITVDCKAGEKSSMSIGAAVLNEEVFRQAYDILSASTLELTHFSSTKVEGAIDCNRDGILYTSIPQNGNWTAQVDGQTVDIVLIGEAMIGVPMAAGSHTVTFVYHNKAFSLGWKITAFCLVIFLGLAWYKYHPTQKKGKFER